MHSTDLFWGSRTVSAAISEPEPKGVVPQGTIDLANVSYPVHMTRRLFPLPPPHHIRVFFFVGGVTVRLPGVCSIVTSAFLGRLHGNRAPHIHLGPSDILRTTRGHTVLGAPCIGGPAVRARRRQRRTVACEQPMRLRRGPGDDRRWWWPGVRPLFSPAVSLHARFLLLVWDVVV